jgi:hypothetical protein
VLADAQMLKKTIVGEALTDEHSKSIKPEEFTTNNCHEIEYVMDVKIKEGTKSNMRELVVNFL